MGVGMIRDPLEPTLNYDRLLNVVHYVCSQCEPTELGNVKLHKILYFSDMLHFVSTGHALTGVEYQKQRFGPCARHLSKVIDDLRQAGRLRVELRDFYGFKKMDYISLIKPSLEVLHNQGAISLIDEVIDFVCGRSAKEISELSHTAAWEAVEFGERIPYLSAYWLKQPEITDKDVAEAERRVSLMPEFA